MKKFIAIVLVLIIVLSLAACGGPKKPSGTYVDATGLNAIKYTFKGSKVTTVATILGFSKETEGTFTVPEEGKVVITFSDGTNQTLNYNSGTDSFQLLGKDYLIKQK